MQQLPQGLITKALALTGKTTDNVEVLTGNSIELSIEKFCFYLLSPEFIDKFSQTEYGDFEFDASMYLISKELGNIIYEYQKGNSQPLIDLLSKI